jgi:hypothetical protein
MGLNLGMWISLLHAGRSGSRDLTLGCTIWNIYGKELLSIRWVCWGGLVRGWFHSRFVSRWGGSSSLPLILLLLKMFISGFIITIISVASKIFKNAHFENVLLSTRKPYGRRITNLFRKLKLSCTCSNSTELHMPHPWNKTRVKPPSVHTSSAHASYAQQFLSINVSNCAAQCQISWPATSRMQQRDSHA